MVGCPHLRAEIRPAFNFGIGHKALRADRHSIFEDRVLDLAGKADPAVIADGGRAADHDKIADQAIRADDDWSLDAGPVTNPRASSH